MSLWEKQCSAERPSEHTISIPLIVVFIAVVVFFVVVVIIEPTGIVVFVVLFAVFVSVVQDCNKDYFLQSLLTRTDKSWACRWDGQFSKTKLKREELHAISNNSNKISKVAHQ